MSSFQKDEENVKISLNNDSNMEKPKIIKTTELIGEILDDQGFSDFINEFQNPSEIRKSESKSKVAYETYKLLEGNPQLKTFIDNLPNRDEIMLTKTTEITEGRKVADSLIEIYRSEIQKDLGFDISPDDLAIIKTMVERRAVQDSAWFENTKQTLKEYKELPEKINAKISEIYGAIGKDKKKYKKEYEDLLNDADQKTWLQALPLVGDYFFAPDTTEAESKLNSLSDLINTKISEEANARKERGDLEKRLQELKQMLFDQKFAPAAAAHKIAKNKLREQMSPMGKETVPITDDSAIEDLTHSIDVTQKASDIFRISTKGPDKDTIEKYQKHYTTKGKDVYFDLTGFKYFQDIDTGIAKEAEDKMQSYIEKALQKKIELATREALSDNNNAETKTKEAIIKFLSQKSVGNKTSKDAVAFVLKTLVENYNKHTQGSAEKQLLYKIMTGLGVFKNYKKSLS